MIPLHGSRYFETTFIIPESLLFSETRSTRTQHCVIELTGDAVPEHGAARPLVFGTIMH